MSDDENSTMQEDMKALMSILGIPTHARPISPHEVMWEEIIPRVKQMSEALGEASKILGQAQSIVRDARKVETPTRMKVELICRGAEVLGTACGKCSRCRAHAASEVTKCPECGGAIRLESLVVGGKPALAFCDECGWDGWVR